MPITAPRACADTLRADRRRALLRRAAAAAGVALLAACTTLGVPDKVTVDETRIAAALARKLPLERPLAGLGDVRVEALRVKMLPERNRIAAEADARLSERVFRSQFAGAIAFDAALRYEPKDASIRLDQVRVQSVRAARDDARAGATPGANAAWWPQVAAFVAERMLEDLSVMTLDDAQRATLRRAGVEPRAIRVVERGVEVELTAPSAAGSAAAR